MTSNLVAILCFWAIVAPCVILADEVATPANEEDISIHGSQTTQDNDLLDFFVSRSLGGDRWAAAYVREQFPSRVIDLYEGYARVNYRLSGESISSSLQVLREGSTIKKSQAFAHILLLPEEYKQRVAAQIDELAEPQVQQEVSQDAHRLRAAVARELTSLYSARLEKAFERNWQALRKTPNNPSVMMLFSYTPFDIVWELCRDKSAAEKITFLLLRVYTRTDDTKALKELEAYTAEQLVSNAKQTWWPCVVEAPQKDGAYTWVTLAERIVDNSVYNVLRLSMKPSGEWLHLDRWMRWTYLLKMQHTYLNKDALVYGEGAGRMQNYRQQRRPWESSNQPTLWFPVARGDSPMIVKGFCLAVRGIPSGIQVSTADISRAECLDWSQSCGAPRCAVGIMRD